MNEIHIEVENIKCGGCISSIREEFVELLTSLGYPEKGHNSILNKAKSYVSCAVGRINSNEN